MEFNRWVPKMCAINSVSHQMWNIVTIPSSVHDLQHRIIAREVSLQNTVNLIFDLDVKIHHFIMEICVKIYHNLTSEFMSYSLKCAVLGRGDLHLWPTKYNHFLCESKWMCGADFEIFPLRDFTSRRMRRMSAQMDGQPGKQCFLPQLLLAPTLA